MNSYVWYVSYGSNMLTSRFYCYLQGGIPYGSTKFHVGCRDKALPVAEKNIEIHRALYFAKEQSSWGKGGVAFIKPDEDKYACTYGKMYLITKEQFEDVVKQENDLSEDFNLNIASVVKNKSIHVFKEAWYNQVIFLGIEEDCPMLTFTHHSFLKSELCSPNQNYINCLRDGLTESYGLTGDEAINYLKRSEGAI